METAADLSTCIWCRQSVKDRIPEHIIPEAIGCPDGMVLDRGEVCGECNHRLAKLDRVLADTSERG